jgi:CheY-like chemotaxis protein
LAGKHILVVEDEYFIASDLQRALKKEGAVVIGPVGHLEEGLALVAHPALDAAVLDVNLEGAQTFAIAARLKLRSIPYVFVTGYDAWALPDAYRDAPRVGKPAPMPALLAVIEQLVTPRPLS